MMKRFLYKSWINVLTVISIVAYVYLVVSTISHNWENFSMAVIRGWNAGIAEGGGETAAPVGEVFSLRLKPKSNNDLLNFSETIENRYLNSEMSYRPKSIKVYWTRETPYPAAMRGWRAVGFFFDFIALFIWFFVPVVFIKLLRTLRAGVFFEFQNVRKLRKIGWGFVIAFVSIWGYNYCYYMADKIFFEFADYDLVKNQTDVILLLVGLVFLIFAEVLKSGLEMKKENDLTV